MGVVLMSKRELNRIDVLVRLDGGRLTTSAAADLMHLTRRQTHRLLKCYRDGGAPAIANRRRGRPSNNRLPDVMCDHAVALVPEHYADFGPTLAAEKLAERHELRVSRETFQARTCCAVNKRAVEIKQEDRFDTDAIFPLWTFLAAHADGHPSLAQSTSLWWKRHATSALPRLTVWRTSKPSNCGCPR